MTANDDILSGSCLSPVAESTIDLPAPPPCPHNWIRDSDELGAGMTGLDDKHFACNFAGCSARMVESWDKAGECWTSTVYPAVVAIPPKPKVDAGEECLTDYDKGCKAADNARARKPPPYVDEAEWLRGYDEQTKRNRKPGVGEAPDGFVGVHGIWADKSKAAGNNSDGKEGR